MMERRKIPIGVLVFIIFIIVLDAVYFFSLANSLMSVHGDLTGFLSFSTFSIMRWIDVVLATLSLVIIPYGFVKRKNGARIYAFVFLVWSLFRAIAYISMTGEKIIGFPLFVLFIISIMYLLMSPVKRYFGKNSKAIVPSEIMKEYTYGLYTLYSELVQLKNGKTQIIYFFSKRKPKSGNPTTFPDGFEVAVSKRSGLPYLKKRRVSPNIS
jgi:hypothetical protein